MFIYNTDGEELIKIEGNRLTGANLQGKRLDKACLVGKDLYFANLAGTTLKKANLRYANLCKANLSGANLKCADLRGANLSGANLTYANLAKANFQRANLFRTDLSKAHLTKVNFTDANLTDANLTDAELIGANLTNVTPNNLDYLRICPEGSFIGWKKCRNGVVVKLRIPAKAKRSNATGRKCRAEFVKVLEGEGISNYNSKVKYRKGETVYCDDWDDDRWIECGRGIHFFITRGEAEGFISS